ncbi:hypothetical protein GCM10010232_49290 [Streptomyces amakusaensis]|uniref:Uncharacterized protein n=1 Tax=Streptomyces amakusaensis TaxID=67271 RepID=A0ABW0AM02_9ACTN
MVEGESVPGSTAGFEGEVAHSDATGWTRRFQGQLEELFNDLLKSGVSADGRIDFVWSRPRLPGRLGEGIYFGNGDKGWVVELKPLSEADLRLEVPDDLSGSSPGSDERQPALPGLDDLEAPEMGPSDRAFLVSAAMLHEVDVEKLNSLHSRITEMLSATEVSIRALRNPGKVLGELAEKGEIARVTNHGKIVGWLVPATEAEQHLDDLLKQGRLRRGTPAPIEPIDIEGLERPLSEALADARDGERT